MVVPGERRATDDGATAEAGGGSSSPFGGDELLGWLDILLKGKPDQQALARTEIAMILEARGFDDDAEEAYWTNVQAKATDRRSYERLIALYQRRRDRLSESLVRRQLEEVFAEPELPTPVRAPRPVAPRPGSDVPVSIARQLTAPDSPALAAPAGQPIRRLRGARRAAEAASPAPVAPSARQLPDHPEDRPAQRPARVISSPVVPAQAPSAAPARPAAASSQAALVPAGPQAVQATEVLPAEPLIGPTNRRRRTPLLPNPGRAYRRHQAPTGRLIVLRPTAILALLLASVGAAALIVFLLVSWDRGSGSRLASAGAGQLPARCADAALRFPGAHDPRGAVAGAYRQQGVDVEAVRPGSPRLTVDQAEQVVGGWIGASLLLERAGQPAPKLNEWLDAESPRPTLANAIMAGRHLDSMLTPDEWAEIRSWPASTCEGAFVHNPKNAGLVRLMERVVAK